MDTAGYKGWIPLKFFESKRLDGTPKTTEGFRNVLTGQEVMPEKGHNGDPPAPTGDTGHIRHSSGAYKQNYEQIRWDTSGPKHPGKESAIWPPFAKIYMEI